MRASSLQVTMRLGGWLNLPEEKAWREKRTQAGRGTWEAEDDIPVQDQGRLARDSRDKGALSRSQSRRHLTVGSAGCCRAAH